MDFSLPPHIEALRLKVRAFVEAHVMPLEADRANFDAHENIRLDVLAALREQAKAEGLWAPQMPEARGGLGLPMVGWAAFYEEANRSIFGPLAFNCAAPDDGNMNVLNKVLKTEAMKDKWLTPIIDGQIRSAFVMTEPAPGSGSDPGGMMLTKAQKRDGTYTVYGRKWFISGADGASHFILMARTSDDPRNGLSAFLFHKDQPAGAFCAACRPWGLRNSAALASWNSTASKFPKKTGCWKKATDCASPKCAWGQRALPIACAGRALPSAASKLRTPM